MLSKSEFELLRYVCENDYLNDVFSNSPEYKVSQKAELKALQDKGYIDLNFHITSSGLAELENYRVDNAIILAAGMSTRFIPVSYELPKGLISVKGDVLIERLIEQLLETGVRQIVVVVGYMMEKFLYLREKYNVKLVVNNEFATKNTHSSIYVARDYLRNTYICCSDNYYPKNPFHRYEYRAFYCSVFLPGVSYVERAFTFDEDGLIIDTNKPSHDQWIMYGHAYFDSQFSGKFKPILESYFGRPGVENMYWENVYAENVKELPLYIHQCQPGEILEFDSMDDLKAFDKDYILHNRVKVFENISKVLHCEPSAIEDIVSIKKGLNNRSFKFRCNGAYYVYRHPGVNAANVIDRKHEATSLRIAKELKIDDTLLYVDEEEGWKISRYIDTTEVFDFANKRHVQMLAGHLKKLHDSNISVGFCFDYSTEADKLIEYIKHTDGTAYRGLVAQREAIRPVLDLLEKDKWQVSLCHNDIYEPNLLIEGEQLYLIDWEFAGDSDIGYDICKLFSLQSPKYEELDDWLYLYYGRKTTKAEKLHLLACAAIIYYYWFVWAVYVSKNGESISEYMMLWYDRMNHFRDEVLHQL